MHERITQTLTSLCALCALLLVGCTTVETIHEAPPEVRYVAAVDTYTATVNVLADLREQGAFSAEDATRITMVMDQTEKYLAEWSAAIERGEHTPDAAVHVQEMLQKLLQFEIRARTQMKEGS